MKTRSNSDNILLDKEEQWYENNADIFVPVENQERIRSLIIEAAQKTPRIIYGENPVKKPITLRLPEDDVAALKNRAIMQGMPYQSLISSILHKYINNDLIEIQEARKALVALSAAN